MSIIQPVLTTEQKNEIVAYVNKYRRANQAPPMVWDETIGQFSQYWSYYLVSNNLFQHSKTQLYGENLAWFQGYGTDVMTLIKKSIDNWYNEISLYDFNNPTFSSETGHFTCLVWKSSTRFGMGISLDTTNNTVDVTMNTSPPGNVMGQFAENVLPLLGPTPLPEVPVVPEPIPEPAPIPTSNKASILNKLNNVVYALNINASKYSIFNTIYSIVTEINSTIQILNNVGASTNSNVVGQLYVIINNLYNVITSIHKRRPKATVIAYLNNIISNVSNMNF
jgi:hypothetical protein